MRAVYVGGDGKNIGAENGLSLKEAKAEALRRGAHNLRTFSQRRIAGRTRTLVREYTNTDAGWRLDNEYRHEGGNPFLGIRPRWRDCDGSGAS